MPDTTPWTIATVKATLPDVRVRIGIRYRVIVTGRLNGRLEDFARVTVDHAGMRATYEYAWQTIVHSLNTGRPLTI